MSVVLEQIEEVLGWYEEWQAKKDQQQANALTGETSEIPEKPKFEVTDKSSAEWVMQKITKLYAEIAENNAIADEQIKPLEEEIDRIAGWKIAEAKNKTRHIDFLTSLLEPYHRKILEADPKAKTIKLPHGEMKIRAQQPEIKKDDKILVGWLKLSEETQKFVETKEVPKWGEFKKLCKIENGEAIYLETGEIVDGITAMDRPDKFEVVVK